MGGCGKVSEIFLQHTHVTRVPNRIVDGFLSINEGDDREDHQGRGGEGRGIETGTSYILVFNRGVYCCRLYGMCRFSVTNEWEGDASREERGDSGGMNNEIVFVFVNV